MLSESTFSSLFLYYHQVCRWCVLSRFVTHTIGRFDRVMLCVSDVVVDVVSCLCMLFLLVQRWFVHSFVVCMPHASFYSLVCISMVFVIVVVFFFTYTGTIEIGQIQWKYRNALKIGINEMERNIYKCTTHSNTGTQEKRQLKETKIRGN